MEKTLSVIALVFAVSLAACQPKPENAPAPSPTIESPMQQVAPAPVTTPPAPVTQPSVKKTPRGKVSTQTVTPRLDALEKRVKRMEDAAKQYGFNF